MTENKKVLGATECEEDGIKFKSKWECKVYKMLRDAGLNPQYEGLKIHLQETFEPKVPFYTRVKDRRRLPGFKIDNYKVRAITYSPDFKVEYNGNTYFIEAKGMKTDRYQITVKLFRKWLEENYPNSIAFEVYTQKNVKDTIKIIKNEKSQRNSITD